MRKWQRPVIFGSTIADSLLGIIVIATITFTVGSVIASKLVGRERLQIWIDRTVFILVVAIVITYFNSYQYPVETGLFTGSLIILA